MGNQKKSRIIPAKVKRGGVRQNQHRWQGFHERAAKLSINPVQRARQQDARTTDSYLKPRLEFWKDTNLSRNFVDFTREFAPLCESLPQILHNEQRIFDLLAEYIDNNDEHSLEPLLDLLGHFAHDLGARFERFFASSLKAIASLVAGHQEIEVIEWSFNTLAWLFQYLSKLLVPDLRPTYDILAPLLGKSVRKEHVARFAAEALSFLIRKAATRHQRDPQPLEIIIEHVLQDWSDSKGGRGDEDVYGYGLMRLLADTIKDVQASQAIKASGLPVYRALLRKCMVLNNLDIAVGVTTSLIHHTNAQSFAEILEEILVQVNEVSSEAPTERLLQACEIMFTVCSVRKGNRISDWRSVLQTSQHLFTVLQLRADAGMVFSNTPTRLAASLMQTASFDTLVPHLQKMMETFSDSKDLFNFPQLCLYAWEINSERFHELLKPYMFRYLARNPDDGDVRMLFSAQTIITRDDATTRNLSPSIRIHFKSWPDRIAAKFEKWDHSDKRTVHSDAMLDMVRVLTADSAVRQRVADSLQSLILQNLDDPLSWSLTERRLFFGGGLSWYLEQISTQQAKAELSWGQLQKAEHDHGSMPLYLENLLKILELTSNAKVLEVSSKAVLIQNLATDSGALRLAALRLLDKMYALETGSEATVLRTAIAIENTPADHQSLRVLAMHVGRMPSEYAAVSKHAWLAKAVVYYLFGLLNIKLAPLWKDVTDAMRHIYESGSGDGIQLLEDIAFQWLETRQPTTSETPDQDESEQHTHPDGPINEFQCTNARKWISIFEHWGADLVNCDVRLTQRFEAKHKQIAAVPDDSIGQALRVLAAIPVLAERRSRRLVPLFLQWASTDEDSEATLVGDNSPELNSDKTRSGLSRRDQKAMLDVFGLFQNPNVLHQSAEVYNALLRLLGNGDNQMQKAALKALLTWKQSGVKKYHEELNNLLDNARFREELIIFLPGQTEESGLPPKQRKELMRVLLRLLYGRIIARGSAAGGRASQSARRKAVFEALGNFPHEDLSAFVDIVLGPLRGLTLKDGAIVPDDPVIAVSFPIRKQLGFVRLAKDLLDSLGDKLESFTELLLNAILYCLGIVSTAKDEPVAEDVNDEELTSMSSLQKAIRQAGLQCLVKLFKTFKSVDLDLFSEPLDHVAISPRLGPNFAAENAQSVSSTMQLFSVWASKPETKAALFVNDALLPQILECLKAEPASATAKPEVKIFIIEQILEPLISGIDQGSKQALHQSSFFETLLARAASILAQGGSKDLLASAVSIILEVANLDIDEDAEGQSTPWSSALSQQLVEVFRTLLDLPNNVVNAKTKTAALSVLSRFLPTLAKRDSVELLSQLYQTLAKLFSTAKEAEMRVELSRAFERAAVSISDKAIRVAQLCAQMNAFSMGRLEEPDYDERERAFEAIGRATDFEDQEWMPLMHNALFFIKDQEELVVRKGASQLLRRFIEANSTMEQAGETTYPTSKLLRGILLPALRRGASERAELVRVEYLTVMAHLIKCCPGWLEVQDLASLATSSEDSESFFDGILHIQQDWRKRSLIRLARTARQGHLGSNNIAHYLLPLVEQFVFDRAEDDDAHSLAAQAVLTIGAMIANLDWTQARKTLRHYSSIIKDKPELEKAVIRLIGVTTEAMFVAATSDDETGILRKTIPSANDLATDVGGTLLPPLASFLRHKDETVVSLRVPIAVSAARLICLLPNELLEYKLAPVLTDVCNILRSKAQESRDLSRKTLSEIAALIGPARFAFILKELRVALSKGYQLHVLSYTLHSLLVEANFQPGDLDYCLPEVMRIVLDDIFGATGQEKDADGYTNKAKEVKGSKSMDTAERVAKITTVAHFKDLIFPIQRFLVEKLDAHATVKVDELLRRIRIGIEQNESTGTRDTLVFCYEVLQQAKITASKAQKNVEVLTRTEKQRKVKFEIETKGARKAPILPRVSSQQYKLARFALDLLRELLRRHEDLRTSANISGFLTPVGDILLDAQEEAQIAALRFLASVMKLPMQEWNVNAPVYADTAYKAIRNQPDTNTELSQAALKLLTSVIRDRPEVSLKDSQVSWLIKAVIPDLTQPSAQGVTFNFLKAIVQRQIVINEIYEAMDAVAKLFITYGDGSARNQARSIWLHFVTTYEQSEKRFDQQLAFLIRNLDYKHTEGRQSVMEAINFLLGKLDHAHQQKAILALFIPVMSRFIGDETASCRDMAGLLLKTIVSKTDDDTLATIKKALQNYLARGDRHSLQTAALRVYCSFVEADAERARKDLSFLLERVQTILDDYAEGDNTDWELPFYALQLISQLCESYASELSSPKLQPLWTSVYRFSAYPHAWVKWAAAKLLRHLFGSLGDTSPFLTGTLKTATGLTINHAQLCSLIRSYFRTMLRRDVQDWLVSELTRNLETLDATVGNLSMLDGTIAGGNEAEDDDGADEDEADADATAKNEQLNTGTLRGYSLTRISTIIRRDSPLIAKRAVLELLSSIVGRMPTESLEPLLLDILRPLGHLTDQAITQTIQADEQAKELQSQLGDKSHDIMTMLQRKLPDGVYVATMHKVQQEARLRREERRSKRRIEAVANPESYAKGKAVKRMKGRERRKDRNEIERSKRRGY